MPEQVARAHTSQSNRAKARADHERKVVFRSVVDNPFRVQWPSVPTNIQNTILACVVDMLRDVAVYHIDREQLGRKRRRSPDSHEGRSSKRPKGVPGDTLDPTKGDAPASMEVDRISSSPSILQHVKFGINEVTRHLEILASSYRKSVSADSSKARAEVASNDSDAMPKSRIVIACRGDVDPPILIGHLPNLVATCNSLRQHTPTSQGTFLVPMPKGAESTLAEAMCLRRVSVILIEESAPGFAALATLLQNVPLPSAPWLCPPATDRQVTLIPTHIKQLRTSAPKDMKAAKERRSQERAAAKERRRSRQQTIPKRLTLLSQG